VVFLALLFSLYPQSDAIAAGRSKHGKSRSSKRARSRAPKINPAIGVYVQTLEGETLLDSSSEQRFNPASVVKIATSFAALEQLGYDYRFGTSVYTDGDLDKDGVLQGNLIVSGTGDPGFFTENAFLVVERLRSLGIRSVSGDLIVVPP